ncbi:MAG TPA: hypothetical protein VNL18_09910 [Gemmatimonadales bacterium]|nr:hypothetical protein [Gemmatimonadales bacterium]
MICIALSSHGCDRERIAEPPDPPSAYTIVVVPDPPEGGNVAGGGTYPEGAAVTVTATAARGYAFVRWAENGVEVSSSAVHTFRATGNRSLVGQFMRRRHTVAISGAGTGHGTVVSNPPGIACEIRAGRLSGVCANQYFAGIALRLVAIADAGSTFDGWSGDCRGTGSCLLDVEADHVAGATFTAATSATMPLGYLDPANFSANTATIDLAASPSGATYLFVVPDLGSHNWYLANVDLGNQLVDFRVVATQGPGSAQSSVRPLPSIERPSLNLWTTPAAGSPSGLPQTDLFYVYSQTGGNYVAIPGRLVSVGTRYAIYEDTGNQDNFSAAEYAVIQGILDTQWRRVEQLFGSPTDLDGNGRVIVFVSRTMMQHRRFGQAYVDNCHLRPDPGPCVRRGEFIYIAGLDYFAPVTDRRFYVETYYPRNILHETIHLMQQAHAFRRTGGWASFSVPAFYGEGQAEIMSFEAGFRAATIWDAVRRHLVEADQSRRNAFFYPYELGALFYLFLHRTWGDGIGQRLIDAAYDGARVRRSLTELAVGVPEGLAVAMFYAALVFDGTEFGSRYGLEFAGENVREQLGSVGVPVREVGVGGEGIERRSYTGCAVFRVAHVGPVRIVIEASWGRAYILIAQPRGG